MPTINSIGTGIPIEINKGGGVYAVSVAGWLFKRPGTRYIFLGSHQSGNPEMA